MAGKGFWSRLFGGGADDDPSRQKPEPRPHPEASEPTEPDAPPQPPPPAQAAADDGETRVSGSSKPGFKTNAVSNVYAKALFELAEQAGTLETIALEVEQLGRTLADSPDLARLISSRALSRDKRAGLIDRVFKGNVHDTLYKFVQVLNRKDRLAELPSVTVSFAALMSRQRGIVEVDAYVAQRLEPAEAERVAASIGQTLGKQVVLHQYVDETLIGGLKLRVGDQMIDGSVATKLAKMKRDLIAAGREHARQQVAAEA